MTDTSSGPQTGSSSHIVARAFVNELHRRAPILDALPDLRGVQITVKFDPGSGVVRGVSSSIETGGYKPK